MSTYFSSHYLLRFAVTFFFLILPVTLSAADTDTTIHGDPGVDPSHGHFSSSANETIDPFGGGLNLSYTDFSLPGNGGLDLNVHRTYDSKRIYNGPGTYSRLISTRLGYGWDIFLAKLKKNGKSVSVELGDGTAGNAVRINPNNPMNAHLTDFSYWYVSKQNWRVFYQLGAWGGNYIRLLLPDGTEMLFGESSGTGYYYATKISKNGQEINIYYDDHVSGKIDYIIDTLNRKIDFTYSNVAGDSHSRIRLTKIQLVSIDGQPIYNGQSVGYTYIPVNPTGVINPPYMLSGVTMPAGAIVGDSRSLQWSYFYNEDNYNIPREAYELRSVLTPYGIYGYNSHGSGGNPGETVYTYANFSKLIIPGHIRKHFRGVAKKTITPFIVNNEFHDGGDYAHPLTWTFNYETGQQFDITTITDPNGEKVEHHFYGFSSNLGAKGMCWAYGLEAMTDTIDSSNEIKERILYYWNRSDDFISYENHRIPYICNDSKTYIPHKTKQTIWQEGVYHITSYSDFDIYGNSKTIIEEGNLSRKTDLNYWYNPTRNIVTGKVLNKTVTGDQPGTFSESFLYDDYGRQTKHNQFGVVTNYTYGSNGNLATVIDANQNTTSYTWQYGRISGVTNPKYSVSRDITWNSTISSETNGRNFTTHYDYDNLQRVIKVQPPVGNPTIYEYSKDAGIRYKREQKGGIWSKSYFDGQGRIVHTENNLGMITDTYFHTNGRKNYVTSNTGDTTYFDFFGRPSSIIHKDGNNITYSYVTNSTIITDEDGIRRSHYFDFFGSPGDRLLSYIEDPDSHYTSYNYNVLGSLLEVQNAWVNNRDHTFTYDSHNFLTQEDHPETAPVSYTRDSLGNVKTRTDELGTLNYFYDTVNRLIRTEADNDTVYYDYDNTDNLISLRNTVSDMTLHYDAANRLSSKGIQIDNSISSSAYTYDGNSNLASLTYPSGMNVQYTYNTNDQLTGVYDFGGSVSDITYYTSGLQRGLMQSYTFSNGVTTLMDYNNRKQLSGLIAESNILNREYRYDARGNLMEIVDNQSPDNDKTFAYDDFNRLTDFSGAWGVGRFAYDEFGNRTQRELNSSREIYQFDRTSNRLNLTYDEGNSWTNNLMLGYNLDGDVISLSKGGENHLLDYDNFHNLSTYSKDGVAIAEYSYNANGQRVKKVDSISGITTYYHHDPQGNSISETDSEGETIEYVYMGSKIVSKQVHQ